MILDEMIRARTDDAKAARERIGKLLEELTSKKNEDNAVLIWQKDVIKEKPTEESESKEDSKKRDRRRTDRKRAEDSYDTRPKHSNGDFEDFGYFSYLGFADTREKIQKEFVNLFHELRKDVIEPDVARNIKKAFTLYCNPFPMEESSGKRDACTEILYNVLTPFYDDIDDAISRPGNKGVELDLIDAKKQLTRLIYGRTMLTT